MKAPGLGESRRSILESLKREGRRTTPQLAEQLGLSPETVRSHLSALAELGLVERGGSLRSGPGRPEIVYVLTPSAEALFPRREGELLRELATHLEGTGRGWILRDFFRSYVGARREAALARVEGLQGRARLEETARILSELGFMAVVDEHPEGDRLRLCHCPLRELVEVTKMPCRVEVGFVKELLGEHLTRVSYIPDGDASCSYRREESRRGRRKALAGA